jgi:hypothetical protein
VDNLWITSLQAKVGKVIHTFIHRVIHTSVSMIAIHFQWLMEVIHSFHTPYYY